MSGMPAGPTTARGPSTVRAQRSDRILWCGLLAAFAVGAVTILVAGDHARSWSFFEQGVEFLVTADAPLALYRTHPELQFGPVVLVVVAPIVALPGDLDDMVAVVLASLAGAVALWWGRQAIRLRHPEVGGIAWDRWLLVVTALFIVFWLRLAAYTTHVDDVLVLVALAAVGLSLERGRPGVTTGLLAFAAAAKPWAVVFAPVAALGSERLRVGRAVLVVAAAVSTWLPFVVGASGTVVALGDFALPIDQTSGLRALGVLDATTPGWVRPTQLVVGLVVTAVAVVGRRDWPAALAAGVTARIALDPSTNHYYTTGFVLVALLWEADRWPGRLPWRTLALSSVLVASASGIVLGGLMPMVRLTMLTAFVTFLLATPAPETLGSAGERGSPRTG